MALLSAIFTDYNSGHSVVVEYATMTTVVMLVSLLFTLFPLTPSLLLVTAFAHSTGPSLGRIRDDDGRFHERRTRRIATN